MPNAFHFVTILNRIAEQCQVSTKGFSVTNISILVHTMIMQLSGIGQRNTADVAFVAGF
jgi:hypothetical protein